MSEHKPKKTAPTEPRKFGWIAEYSDEHALLKAARKVRDSGYTKTDAFTPFPVHGIDEALGIKPTVLPFIVLCAGFTGLGTAALMQYWTNAIDYPYIISGKPFGSWPAFIPVCFELTVLFSAFTTFLGMIALNKLPRFSNPVFTSSRFDRATDDKFFLYVDSSDKYFNRQSVQELLAGTSPESLEEVVEDTTPSNIPRIIWYVFGCLIVASWIPAAIVYKMRQGKSELPRFHVFLDMDFQPKKKPQQYTSIFADGRSMQPQVAGTVARGQLTEADPYYLGYDPGKLAALEPKEGHLVSLQQTGTGDGAAQAAAPAGPNLPWITDVPVEVNAELMELGKRKFNTYCSTCHGLGGDGDGLVARRADQLAQGFWLPPTSLHDPRVRAQSVGQLFYTISNGKGKMAGYGPSLDAKERWAIVVYARALQRSRNANENDVPEDQKSSLKAP